MKFIAVLLLLVSASAYSAPPLTPLAFACAELKIDCKGIDPPTILVTPLMGEFGLWGAYWPGEKWVYVDPNAPGSTVVHEVTHYMLYEAGMRFSRCAAEEAARRVQHAWDGTDYEKDNWEVRYKCNGKGASQTVRGWGGISKQLALPANGALWLSLLTVVGTLGAAWGGSRAAINGTKERVTSIDQRLSHHIEKEDIHDLVVAERLAVIETKIDGLHTRNGRQDK